MACRPGGGVAVLVTVRQVQGSAPREEGAWMAVLDDMVINTLGGGHLEFSAIALARQYLKDDAVDGPFTRRFALGPSLGQCCGGVVELGFERLQGPLDTGLVQRLRPRGTPVALFGGGHVGKALVRILATLPFDVRWVDSRDEIFPPEVPGHVHCEHSDPVQAAVADLAPGSRVLIMSFSHAEDLDVVQACLKRQRLHGDLPFIGLIGSKTKWATFGHRLRERGFSAQECAQVTCPIGITGIAGKEPEAIAVAVAAQLLQLSNHEAQSPG
ncbi:MAG: xanthine dehydrogenase accessory protein XdhC [Rubrivivax sp.]|nr:xanthine dehydrogenase accessory protein XdhC [Rubrivivax sp.]